ncbi:hypothetical protein KC19_1G016000, partial [Ceratodon purpureus]
QLNSDLLIGLNIGPCSTNERTTSQLNRYPQLCRIMQPKTPPNATKDSSQCKQSRPMICSQNSTTRIASTKAIHNRKQIPNSQKRGGAQIWVNANAMRLTTATNSQHTPLALHPPMQKTPLFTTYTHLHHLPNRKNHHHEIT